VGGAFVAAGRTGVGVFVDGVGARVGDTGALAVGRDVVTGEAIVDVQPIAARHNTRQTPRKVSILFIFVSFRRGG